MLGCNMMGRKEDPGSDTKAVSDTVYLGQGYDSDSFQTRDACVVGEERIEAQPLSEWQFKRIDNWEIAKREMGYSVEGEYTYGIAKVTAKSSFTRNMQDTDLTSSYLLVADYLGVTKFLRNGELPASLVTRFESGDAGKSAFRRRCGDRYVSQVDSGGMLRVIVKFRFSNKSLKENFSFTAGVTAGAVASVSATTTAMNENEKRNSSAEITIHQEGGDLAHLGSIINPDASIECSLDNWAQCQNMIKKIMEYSVNTFPTDVGAGKGRLYAYKTTPYFEVEFSPLSEEVQAKRLATMIEMEKQDYDVFKAQTLLKDRENNSLDDRKRELENLKSLISRNVSKLTTNLLNCVEYPNDVVRCVELSALKLESYDATKLAQGLVKIIGPVLGGTVGVEFEQTCRNFMTGAQGTSGKIVDQLAVACDDGRILAPSGRNQADRYYNKNCPAGQVVTGMRGARGDKDGIGSLTFACSDIAALRSKAAQVTTSEFSIIAGGRGFTWDCPAGLAAVGLKGKSEKYLSSIALICVSY